MFSLGKYQGKWAVLDNKTKVWYFIGCGKKFCSDKVIKLNKEINSTLRG